MRCRGADIPLKAVLFDLDGTLIDSRKDIAASANAIRGRYGLAPLPEETVGSYVGLGIMFLLEKALETRDAARLKEAHQFFKAHYRDHCVDHTRAFEGTLDLLGVLRARGIKMGLVSNKPQEFTDLILEKLGLAPYFGVVLGPEATVNKKPHPEPLLTALRRLGAKPAEAVMIGDSTVDIEAARAVPMPVGVVTHGYGTRDILNAADPDWMADSLKEFIDLLA
jgi:2-phosphoglycolate phosphatase